MAGAVADGLVEALPLLNFKVTADSIWMLNPDGTLYCRVGWDQVKRASLDAETDVWTLRGGFFDHSFGRLRLEPMADYRGALAEVLAPFVRT